MLKEVAAKLPHIKVDMQLEAPSPTPNESWITRVVSGDVPDLVISSGALFEWMAKRNVWADMRPALQKMGWKQGDFFANPNTLSYAGKQYAVPFVAHQGGALVYNRTLFGEAGVPEPTKDWTWDDVLEAARRLTSPEKKQWGINGHLRPWHLLRQRVGQRRRGAQPGPQQDALRRPGGGGGHGAAGRVHHPAPRLPLAAADQRREPGLQHRQLRDGDQHPRPAVRRRDRGQVRLGRDLLPPLAQDEEAGDDRRLLGVGRDQRGAGGAWWKRRRSWRRSTPTTSPRA